MNFIDHVYESFELTERMPEEYQKHPHATEIAEYLIEQLMLRRPNLRANFESYRIFESEYDGELVRVDAMLVLRWRYNFEVLSKKDHEDNLYYLMTDEAAHLTFQSFVERKRIPLADKFRHDRFDQKSHDYFMNALTMRYTCQCTTDFPIQTIQTTDGSSYKIELVDEKINYLVIIGGPGRKSCLKGAPPPKPPPKILFRFLPCYRFTKETWTQYHLHKRLFHKEKEIFLVPHVCEVPMAEQHGYEYIFRICTHNIETMLHTRKKRIRFFSHFTRDLYLRTVQTYVIGTYKKPSTMISDLVAHMTVEEKRRELYYAGFVLRDMFAQMLGDRFAPNFYLGPNELTLDIFQFIEKNNELLNPKGISLVNRHLTKVVNELFHFRF